MDPQYTYMVCVRCMTFNHHAYIEDAMNGFCIQKTDFPFVCAVVDDASTDGEQEVIKKYIDEHFELLEKEETVDYVLNFGRHKTNGNCYFVVLYLKYNHFSITKNKDLYFSRWKSNSKYISLCEGDDYWIDPLKLQKQVAFLESNEDYSMTFHSAEIVYEDDIPTGLQCSSVECREYSPNEVLENWIVPTASIVARMAVSEVKNKKKYKLLNGDVIFVLNCAKIGKLRGMSDKMSVYRVQANGVTYDISRKRERAIMYPDHFRYIKDNYPFIDHSLINEWIGNTYAGRVKYDENLFQKIKDLIRAFYFCPRLIFKALVMVFHPRKK